jgi:hypothetical protein
MCGGENGGTQNEYVPCPEGTAHQCCLGHRVLTNLVFVRGTRLVKARTVLLGLSRNTQSGNILCHQGAAH